MDNAQLQKRIEVLEKQMASLNQSSSITYQVDNAFNNRGFIKTDFFVAGKVTLNAQGVYWITAPIATNNSIVLVSGPNGDESGSLTSAYVDFNFGASSSRFDITNPAGDTFRYTWDGTGTNPNISATTLPTGSLVTIFSFGGTPFNTVNQTNATTRPYFTVTASGSNYFEVSNPTPGVAENNVTLGTGGAITGMLQTTTGKGVFLSGLAGAEISFIVFLFNSLLVNDLV